MGLGEARDVSAKQGSMYNTATITCQDETVASTAAHPGAVDDISRLLCGAQVGPTQSDQRRAGGGRQCCDTAATTSPSDAGHAR